MSLCEGIIQILFTSYIIGFSIVAKYTEENIPPWIFFLLEVSVCIFQTILLYNQLDYLFPQIIFDDTDYKRTRITKTQIFIRYFVFSLLVLLMLFLIFTSIAYVINFSNISGIYYLQIIQTCLAYYVVFYFLNNAFDDFSGQAYCEFYQSQNSKEIKFHFIPMTLTPEMKEIYDNEFYIHD